jgi:hypothetical protein
MFFPSITQLGTVTENQSLNFEIYYEEEDIITLALTRYPVTIVPNQTNPSTILIQSLVSPIRSRISGYYFDSFTNSIQYRTPTDTFVTVPKFEQIDITKLSEMVSYDADTTFTKNYTYTATARDGLIVKGINIYTITVQNDWTNGKNSLQTYVGYTV